MTAQTHRRARTTAEELAEREAAAELASPRKLKELKARLAEEQAAEAKQAEDAGQALADATTAYEEARNDAVLAVDAAVEAVELSARAWDVLHEKHFKAERKGIRTPRPQPGRKLSVLAGRLPGLLRGNW